MSDVLDRATRALKEEHASASAEDAARVAARSREAVLERAELGRRERRVTRAILIPIAASFVLFASWAAASGALERLWNGAPSEVPEAPSAAPTSSARAGSGLAAPTAPIASAAPVEVPSVEPPSVQAPSVEAPTTAPGPSAPPQRATTLRAANGTAASPAGSGRAPQALVSAVGVTPSAPPAPPAPPAITDALYATAHRAHFEDHDWPRALAAWDAYIADSPDGRFAPEARYNRALCLIRLGRHADAITALRPFADGTFGAYRKDDATRLLSALADAGRAAP